MTQKNNISEKSTNNLISNPFAALERIEILLQRIEYETLPILLRRLSKWDDSIDSGSEKLISKRDASLLLGCSVSTIDNLRRSGKLELIKVGKSARFRLSDLQSMIRRESK